MDAARSVRIAGDKTGHDWAVFAKSLVPGEVPETWDIAFKDFFRARLDLRYLEPIHALRELERYRGEGFSIVAIHCTLIEFLAATAAGKSYRFLRKGQTLGPYEYSRSGELFVEFLSKAPVFSRTFTKAVAEDFYSSIRCGLLHEATTKNDWRIHATSNGGAAIDGHNKIVFRNDLADLIEAYVADYGVRLRKEKILQEAFIRKFNDLAA